jgi:hypothetical protein
MNEFNVDSFLIGLEEDKITKRDQSNRLTKILMNTKDNQGTVIIIPFMNKKTNNFYLKLSNVKEWNGHTTKLNVGSAWYKILPDEYYVNLSPENQSLLAEINGLFNSINELTDDYNIIRIRNYSLIYGVMYSHTNAEGKIFTDNVDKPCLFIFPSHSLINAIHIAVGAKCQAFGGKSWITKIFNPNNTGRTGVISITFVKPDSPGYNSTVAFEVNSEFKEFVNPTRIFDEEIKFFDDPIRDFLGWQGADEGDYFNVEIMKELRADLKLELNRLELESKSKEQTYENKNGHQDPMKSTPMEMAPAIVDATSSPNSQTIKSTDLPF